jgi:hypothetical protein
MKEVRKLSLDMLMLLRKMLNLMLRNLLHMLPDKLLLPGMFQLMLWVLLAMLGEQLS